MATRPAGAQPWVVGIAALVVVLWLIGLVWFRPWIAHNDFAIFRIALERELAGHVRLVGAHSRLDVFHPGPLREWVFALPYWISGRRSAALPATALVLNVIWSIWVLWLARRLRPPAWGVACAAGLFVLVIALGADLASPWNPHLAILPLYLACWSAVTVISRQGGGWVGCIVGASWAAQLHASALVLGGALLATVLAALVVQRQWGRAAGAIGVCVVLWVGPLVDLRQGADSNIVRLATVGADGESVGLGSAAGHVSRLVWPGTPLGHVAVQPSVEAFTGFHRWWLALLVAVLIGATWVAARRSSDDARPANSDGDGPAGADDAGPANSDSDGPAGADDAGPANSDSDGPAGSDGDGPAGSDDAGPANSDSDGPAGADDAGPANSDSDGPAGADVARPAGSDDAGPVNSDGDGPAGADDARPAGSDDAGPANSDGDGPPGFNDAGADPDRLPVSAGLLAIGVLLVAVVSISLFVEPAFRYLYGPLQAGAVFAMSVVIGFVGTAVEQAVGHDAPAWIAGVAIPVLIGVVFVSVPRLDAASEQRARLDLERAVGSALDARPGWRTIEARPLDLRGAGDLDAEVLDVALRNGADARSGRTQLGLPSPVTVDGLFAVAMAPTLDCLIERPGTELIVTGTTAAGEPFGVVAVDQGSVADEVCIAATR